MSNIEKYQKPQLATLREEKKLKDYEDVERLTVAETIVSNLLDLIGVSNKSNEEHHIALVGYLMKNEYEFTPREIMKAYDLSLRGKLGIDLFQQLNTLQYNKVMNAFRTYRNKSLKNYNLNLQKQKIESKMIRATEEEKKEIIQKALIEQFFLSNNDEPLDEHRFWIFDYLFERGLISEEDKKITWKIEWKKEEVFQKKKSKHIRLKKDAMQKKIILKVKEILITNAFKKFDEIESLFDELNR
tara:strand:- start:66 stop:794 length:729 start_codon:yes stop_codon:yes gene_type:complete